MSEMDLLPKKLKEKEKIQINFSKVSRDAARTTENISDGELCNNSQRLLAVNYCRKALHLRCL